MGRYTHVHCVCGGSEPEYISGQKDFSLGPRGGGATSFQFSSRAEQKIFIAAYREQMFFQHKFPISGAPLVVINDTSLSKNDSKTKYRSSIHQ